jgi:hypothetical protein
MRDATSARGPSFAAQAGLGAAAIRFRTARDRTERSKPPLT